MKTEEIVKLSRQSVLDLIEARTGNSEPFPGPEKRRKPRWPFPGTVELHATDGTTGQWFGTCRNISETGLGMACERFFENDMVLDIAIHLPEVTLWGKGVVRYCQNTPSGYMTGVEFIFEE